MATDGMVANRAAPSLMQWAEAFADRIRHVPGVVWRRLCIALLALWLVFSLARLFWLIMPEPTVAEPPLQLPSNISFTNQPDNAGSGVDIAALKSQNLFGDASAMVVEPAPVATGIEDEAVNTRLRLDLKGVNPSDVESASTAIIADGPRQKVYHIGDELEINPRGVKLMKILSDRVIFDNQGNIEALWLYEADDPAAPRVANNRRATPISVPSRAAAVNSEFIGRGPPPEDISTVDDLVDAIRPEEGQLVPNAQQVKAITDVIKVQMHREGGQFIGYKIRPGRNRELFEELGLQPNDVVVAVNNVTLDDTQKAMEMYRSLGQETSATLEVLRDGASITIPISLDDNN